MVIGSIVVYFFIETKSSPPFPHLSRLRTYLNAQAASKKKFRRVTQNSTQLLRELEISLRTNHTGWLKEFLHNETDPGLDLLDEYLAFVLYPVLFGSFSDLFTGKKPSIHTEDKDINARLKKSHGMGGSTNDRESQNFAALEEAFQNGEMNEQEFLAAKEKQHRENAGDDTDTDGGSDLDQASKIDIAVSQFDTIRRSHELPAKRILKNSKLLSNKDDIHVTIMCFRSIFNYKYGFDAVLEHKTAVNHIALALKHHSIKTRTTVLVGFGWRCNFYFLIL